MSEVSTGKQTAKRANQTAADERTAVDGLHLPDITVSSSGTPRKPLSVISQGRLRQHSYLVITAILPGGPGLASVLLHS